MKPSSSRRRLLSLSSVVFVLVAACGEAGAQRRRGGAARRQPAARVAAGGAQQVRERDVRAHMEFLASDAMQGRGSGTQFELLAGHYIASQLRQYGVEPAGDADAAGQRSFLQTVATTRQAFAAAPVLSFAGAGGVERRWTHGREMLSRRLAAARVSGPLQKLGAGGQPAPGAFVLLARGESGAQQSFQQATALARAGAAAVLLAETAAVRERWVALGASMPELPAGAQGGGSVVVLSADAYGELERAADGTQLTIEGALAPAQTNYTWNVVGVLRGSDAGRSAEAVLLSAHMDHLGVRAGGAGGGDQIYNGADDDASGVVAVLELARALGAGARPKRTIYFVAFGSEERGGRGSQHFIANSPVALEKLVANLQFEMIGRPDAKVAADTLWLTGYERSDLGPELARQGARLVADPHPAENFFQRSDNYALARRGVVAHTVSSFGLHPQYHQPDDELSHIDFPHMTRAINSMIRPVLWLANSAFTPAWVEGKKP